MSRWSLTLLDSRQSVHVYETGKTFRAELHSPVREASLGYVDHTTEGKGKTVVEALQKALRDSSFLREVPEIAARIEGRWREK